MAAPATPRMELDCGIDNDSAAPPGSQNVPQPIVEDGITHCNPGFRCAECGDAVGDDQLVQPLGPS